MISIISSLSAHAAAVLLRPEIVGRLSLFRNFETAQEIFDYLWDVPDHIDFILTDRVDFEMSDLDAASQRRPDMVLIIVGKVERDLDLQAPNVIFVETPDELSEAVLSKLP